MNELRRFIQGSLVALVAGALLSGGCDTLRARATAQDGVEAYRNGDVKQAADLFEKAAQIDPTVPAIQLNRGFTSLSLYQLSPKTKEGQKAASTAIESFKLYMTMSVKQEQKQKARDYLLQTFVDAGKYDEAVAYFKPDLDKTPPNIEALTILGNIAKTTGKTAEARKWLEMRIQADPKDADGYLALANMDFEELCADSSCRSSDPQKPPPQMPAQQRIDKANHGLDLLKKAIDMAPNNPNLLVFANLLLIQRTYAYQPQVDLTGKKTPAQIKAAEEDAKKVADDKKRADLDEAAKYRQKAMDMMKAAGTISATPAGKDGAAKDGAAKDAKTGAAPAATPEKK